MAVVKIKMPDGLMCRLLFYLKNGDRVIPDLAARVTIMDHKQHGDRASGRWFREPLAQDTDTRAKLVHRWKVHCSVWSLFRSCRPQYLRGRMGRDRTNDQAAQGM